MPHPSANKRSEAQKSADYLLIEKWAIQGKTVRGIAIALAEVRPYKLSHVQIQNDLTKLKRQWLTEAAVAVAEVKAKDLKALARLDDVAWDQFERSCKDAVVETSKIKGGSDGGKGSGKSIEKGSRKEGQCGDPQYLRVILDVQKRRSDLLGMNAPTKTELAGPDGGPVQVAGSPVIVYLPKKEESEP